MVFLCITEPSVEGERLRLGIGRRIWIFLMIGAASVLIWTSMYVAFTVPGSDIIAGVQGRYFIPLIFPLYILINRSVGGRVLARQNDICYYLLIISEAAVAMISVWSCAVSVFCL